MATQNNRLQRGTGAAAKLLEQLTKKRAGDTPHHVLSNWSSLGLWKGGGRGDDNMLHTLKRLWGTQGGAVLQSEYLDCSLGAVQLSINPYHVSTLRALQSLSHHIAYVATFMYVDLGPNYH